MTFTEPSEWKSFNDYPAPITILRTSSFLIQEPDDGAVPGTSYSLPIASLQAVPFDYIQFNTSPPSTPGATGEVKYNAAERALNFIPGWASGDVVGQIPYEHWFPVRNATETIIPNGTPVVPVGHDGTYMLVIPSDAADKGRVVREVLGVTTMALPVFSAGGGLTGSGVVTRLGKVRGVDTSLLTQGGIVFLAAGGGYTSTAPVFPNSQVVVGVCGVSDAVNGELDVDIRSVTLDSEFDGTCIEKQDASIQHDGGFLYVDVELDGGGNLPLQLNGDRYQLDCLTGGGIAGTGGGTQARSPALTVGTATTTVRNHIWLELSGETPVMQVGLAWPTGTSYAQVAIAVVWSVAKHLTDGPAAFRQTTDAIAFDNRGRIGYIQDWIRDQNATWRFGALPTVTINTVPAPDEVNFTTTGGVVRQVHNQTWPAYNVSTDGAWIANSQGAGTLANYQKVTDLNELLEEADGTSLSGKRFNLVMFGIISRETGQCKIFINLPTGNYNSDDLAYNDPDNTAVVSVPENERFEAFLIARAPLRHRTTGGGTWTFCGAALGRPNWISLLGNPIGVSGSAAGGAISQFSDDIFRVFNNTDPTKELAFDVSGVPTATTRTVAVPGADGTLPVLGFTQTWTAAQYMQVGNTSNRNGAWCSALDLTGNLTFTGTDIGFNSDANDRRMLFAGGQTASISSGPSFRLHGNDWSGTGLGGSITLVAGNTTAGVISFSTGAGLLRFTIDAAGNLVANGTYMDSQVGNSSNRNPVYATTGSYDAAVTLDDVLTLTGNTSDPGSPTDGTIWHRTDTDQIRVRLNGTTYSLDVTAV